MLTFIVFWLLFAWSAELMCSHNRERVSPQVISYTIPLIKCNVLSRLIKSFPAIPNMLSLRWLRLITHIGAVCSHGTKNNHSSSTQLRTQPRTMLTARRIGRGMERRPCLWRRIVRGIFDAGGGGRRHGQFVTGRSISMAPPTHTP
jgi:hypothetical protein